MSYSDFVSFYSVLFLPPQVPRAVPRMQCVLNKNLLNE